MHIKPIRLYEIIQEKIETTKELIQATKNKIIKSSLNLYFVYILYFITTVFLIKFAKFIL
jgi:hypothetical protein